MFCFLSFPTVFTNNQRTVVGAISDYVPKRATEECCDVLMKMLSWFQFIMLSSQRLISRETFRVSCISLAMHFPRQISTLLLWYLPWTMNYFSFWGEYKIIVSAFGMISHDHFSVWTFTIYLPMTVLLNQKINFILAYKYLLGKTIINKNMIHKIRWPKYKSCTCDGRWWSCTALTMFLYWACNLKSAEDHRKCHLRWSCTEICLALTMVLQLYWKSGNGLSLKIVK